MVELAEMYDVSRQAISRGLKSRGITKGSSLDEVKDEAAERAREEHTARIRNASAQVETYSKYYDALSRMTMKKVVDAEKAGRLAAINAEVIVLKNAMSVIEKARSESWSILKIDELLSDDENLPDLNIGEYSAEDLDAIREQNDEAYLETLADEAELDPYAGLDFGSDANGDEDDEEDDEG